MTVKLNSFVLADPQKCIGCKSCEVACAVVHNDQIITTAGTMEIPVIPRLYLVQVPEVTMPVQCRHCEDAPCANACAEGAIVQKNNTIVVEEDACVGCKTCLIACPFGAIDLVPQYRKGQEVIQRVLKSETEDGLVDKPKVIASKCDLCFSREQGPACVEVCPQKAVEIVVPAKEKRKKNEEAALSLFDTIKNFS